MTITERNTVASSPESITMHEALHKLLTNVTKAGHNIKSVHAVTLNKRYSPNTGLHVHANCKVTLRFDESVTEEQAQQEINRI